MIMLIMFDEKLVCALHVYVYNHTHTTHTHVSLNTTLTVFRICVVYESLTRCNVAARTDPSSVNISFVFYLW